MSKNKIWKRIEI